MSINWRRGLRLLVAAIIGLCVLAALAAGGWYLVMTRGLIGATLITLAFFIGFVGLPITAYAIPLGRWGGETVGGLLLKMATLGGGTSVINMTEDDSYEWVDHWDGDLIGPDTFWERFIGLKFGVTYDRTPGAFGDYVEESVREEAEHIADGGPTTVAAESTRGGAEEFIDYDVQEGTFLVGAAEKLYELHESASLDTGMQAKSSALVEFGGDTSNYSPWVVGLFSLLFLAAGAVLSLVVLG